jgi:branched-chain amino acid aminotransferase
LEESKKYAFFEGNFVPLEDAKVSIMTHAFMYGTAVFEGVRAYWNETQQQMYLFRLREHIERMWDSMKILELETNYSIDEFCEIVVELMRRNQYKTDSYIRPSAYKSGLKIGVTLEDCPTAMSVLSVPFGNYFKGVPALKVVVSSWRRVEDNAIPARAKIVGAYVNTALAKADAVRSGFDDCIVLSEDGHVSEGTGMNIFLVKHGHLITPCNTSNILEGITRRTVMELAQTEFNIETFCREVDRSELYIADELFYTGTAAQVTPIVEVDRRTIGDGKIGPISNKISERYIAICRGEVPDYHHWLTPVYKQPVKQANQAKMSAKP